MSEESSESKYISSLGFREGFESCLQTEANVLNDACNGGLVVSKNGNLVGKEVTQCVGPIIYTREAIKKLGINSRETGFIMGQQWSKAMLTAILNTAVGAICEEKADFDVDYWSQGGFKPDDYSYAKELMKAINTDNKAGGIPTQLVIMHSKTYYGAYPGLIADRLTNVGGACIHEGGFLGKDTFITDLPELENKIILVSPYGIKCNLKDFDFTSEDFEKLNDKDELEDFVRIRGDFNFTYSLGNYITLDLKRRSNF